MHPPSRAGDVVRGVEDIPLYQVQSFVTHDIYGPASMLRTYLQAVSDSTEDAELRSMILDAERLSGQVEGMLRFLQANLRLSTGTLEVIVKPFGLKTFLDEWHQASGSLLREDRVRIPTSMQAFADERVLATALDGAAWQMGRMGGRQGVVVIGAVDAHADHCCAIGLWRTDGELGPDLLTRAVAGREEDWSVFLRRLPACGFPLQIALRLVRAMGGKVEVRSEVNALVMVFPTRAPAEHKGAVTKAL